MFTGIVEETGVVHSIVPSRTGIRLSLVAARTARGLKKGDSLAVNGCCLTIVGLASKTKAKLLHFDLLRETWDRTNLQFARPGSLINLERPLRASARLDGHFVTGHIDGLGQITRWENEGKDYVLDIGVAPELMRYIVPKGSIAVDGISLTIAKVQKTSFRVWIIPHTLKITALRERRTGDRVNLETDILGKYVERFLGTTKYGLR
jgi:riboflavin synthase